MAEVKLLINTQHFISAFSMGSLVGDFTDDAVEAILSQYQKLQEASENPMDIAWEPLFNDAEEFNDAGIFYTFKDETFEHTEAFMNLVNTLNLEKSENPDEVAAAELANTFINDEDNLLNHFEIFELMQPKLMAIPAFVKGGAAIIAKSHNLEQLENGNYISLGCY